MGCTSPLKAGYYRPRPGIEPIGTRLSQQETKLLKLLYRDVASRSPEDKMSKEHFYTFFHVDGLWGHSIFKRFDQNSSGMISFEEYRNGIEELVKGNVRKKIRALFDFYDVDQQGSISYSELLEMLYSYPKEELRQILLDEKFLATMSKTDQEYLIKEVNLNKVLLQLEVESASEVERPDPIKRTMSETVDNGEQIDTILKNAEEAQKNGAIAAQPNKDQWDKFLPQKRPMRPPPMNMNRYHSAIAGNQVSAYKNKIKIASNITLLVKRYARFLFDEYGLDVHKDSFSYDQFCEMIQGHEKIFDSYFSGFHNYIWEIPDRQDKPYFALHKPEIEGDCIEIDEKTGKEHHRHLHLHKTTLFVLAHHEYVDHHSLIEIKNLEGLLVEDHQLVKRDLYGFIVKHRDGCYPEKAYMFKHQEQQEEWLKYLDDYRRVPLMARYIVEKKIGTGNFSIVYRARQKQDNLQVAIKEIAKFKLSAEERTVIQHECGVLERCHHPNIVHFLEKSETKTHIYIVTELLLEGDLYEYVRNKGFLEEYEASIIIKQIIQAIMYLNAMGLIHRDLKPENIMVTDWLMQILKRKEKDLVERIKLIDFGFSIYATMLSEIPKEEKFLGSLNYVAPEIIQQREYDQAVDNFSIGVIMYFMLSGTLPFEAIVPEETKRLTIECKPPMDNIHWHNISDQAKDLIGRLIAPRASRTCLGEALKHPWIAELESLKGFVGRNKRETTRYTF